MRRYIEVNLDVEGLHKWADCDIPEVNYLKSLHRHTFKIKCRKEVTHGNRDIEFIVFKKQINHFLKTKFHNDIYDCLNFDSMSCEHIAELLFNEFELAYCSVSEDGEFAGIVTK